MSKIQIFKSETELKAVLAGEYQRQIANFFGDQQKALEFLSNVVASVQRTPKLLECTAGSVVNSFMLMAALKLMPSGVSGEAFVLPYKNKNGTTEAQFQIGYQGIVTLLYRAGNRGVVAELVRKNDKFSLINGKIQHEVDPLKSRKERGEVIGAYAIITTSTGGTVETFMRTEDILAHAAKFSKSYKSSFSPWNGDQDPEGWMPRKTVLKQCAKLAPKNETLNRAIAEDNKDSVISDRLNAAREESSSLAIGNAMVNHEKEENKEQGTQKDADAGEEDQDGQDESISY